MFTKGFTRPNAWACIRELINVYTHVEIEKAGGDFGQVHALVSGKNQDIAWTTGDIDAGMVTVGMCGGLIKDIPTCAELVDNIMTDANQIITERLAAMTSTA